MKTKQELLYDHKNPIKIHWPKRLVYERLPQALPSPTPKLANLVKRLAGGGEHTLQ